MNPKAGTPAHGVRRPPVAFIEIRQQRAHEYVAEQIRRHIALRLVGPGDCLPSERELAVMFGVGRPTIQHALRILEADHLVEARRGRRGGTFVLRLTEDALAREELQIRLLRRSAELEELLVYRRTLEPAIAALAAETRSASDLETMQQAIDNMDAAVEEPEYMRFDTKFHIAIARATHNRHLELAAEEIRIELNDALSFLPESEIWHQRISEEHEAIYKAILARDPEIATTAADLHVSNSVQSVRAVLAAIRSAGNRVGSTRR